ncbi:MAG TPA: hypothetical protein VMN60_08180 [Longimicrobiales bacterium]|nr:hypothetical protein [Longimicrobiales bacterium]
MTTYRVLLPHPLEPRLLMMHAHGEWRLPEWQDATEHLWQVTDHVNRAVAARYGMETTVLRCVRRLADPMTERETRVYELDNHSATHDMIPTTWVGQGELATLRIGDPVVRELVGEWFSRDRGEMPLRGSPWTQRGWYVEALAWTIAQLQGIGAHVLGSPDQLRAWERSFLMRERTTNGTFYFKASPNMFGHEPPLMKWLAERYPHNTPEIVAIDAQRGWCLQREVDGGALPLNEVREEEEWYRAVRRLAEMQLEASKHAHELRALGLPHRGLDVLARRIPRLCADATAMLLGEPCGLVRSEIERVASLAPTLLTLCEELANYGIPDSLEHGDLSASNILSTLNGPIYLDWSDSSLSHPFFTLSQLMSEAEGLLPASSRESRRRLRDNYLAPWMVIASHEELSRAFEIARVLAPVHLAATTHAELLAAAGYRWELECTVPQLMRTALRLLVDDESPLTNQV